MAVEIERRFLVSNEAWRGIAEPKLLYQAYLSVEKERTMRVRIVGDEAWLTLKGYISDVSRHEFEYPIPVQDALTIAEQMCPFKMKKHRYCIEYQGHVFEVDEYFDDNAPLVVAEIELPSEDTEFEKPEWLGEEITHDGRFTNAYLSQHPYSTW